MSESHITSEHLRAAQTPEMISDHARFLLRAQYRLLTKALQIDGFQGRRGSIEVAMLHMLSAVDRPGDFEQVRLILAR